MVGRVSKSPRAYWVLGSTALALLVACGGEVGETAARTTPDDRSTDGGPEQTAPPLPLSDEIGIEYACGFHSSDLQDYSSFLDDGETCEIGQMNLNTFALRLTGAGSEHYSAVVTCGLIRYDNGIFVGDRVVVEARDGQWCHDVAAYQIDLVDRMLLTDVSFRIEATADGMAPRELSLRAQTRAGWTEPIPAEPSICVYVAHEQYGVAACRDAPSLDYCVCPPGEAWEDFFDAVELSLVPNMGEAR